MLQALLDRLPAAVGPVTVTAVSTHAERRPARAGPGRRRGDRRVAAAGRAARHPPAARARGRRPAGRPPALAVGVPPRGPAGPRPRRRRGRHLGHQLRRRAPQGGAPLQHPAGRGPAAARPAGREVRAGHGPGAHAAQPPVGPAGAPPPADHLPAWHRHRGAPPRDRPHQPRAGQRPRVRDGRARRGPHPHARPAGRRSRAGPVPRRLAEPGGRHLVREGGHPLRAHRGRPARRHRREGRGHPRARRPLRAARRRQPHERPAAVPLDRRTAPHARTVWCSSTRTCCRPSCGRSSG